MNLIYLSDSTRDFSIKLGVMDKLLIIKALEKENTNSLFDF